MVLFGHHIRESEVETSLTVLVFCECVMQMGTIRTDTIYTTRLYSATKSSRLQKKEKEQSSTPPPKGLKKAKTLKNPKDKKNIILWYVCLAKQSLQPHSYSYCVPSSGAANRQPERKNAKDAKRKGCETQRVRTALEDESRRYTAAGRAGVRCNSPISQQMIWLRERRVIKPSRNGEKIILIG